MHAKKLYECKANFSEISLIFWEFGLAPPLLIHESGFVTYAARHGP